MVINANDVAVMGVQPRWFLAAVLLPVGTDESEVRELFARTRDALDAIAGARRDAARAPVRGKHAITRRSPSSTS